ncbi:retrovirus-related pol polyprotein from transposon TNT 1-94 [Tanacetum coccineum]
MVSDQRGTTLFPTGSSKLVPSTESKLELLHMDLCGPITKKIIEIIHVKFDELTTMASECNNLEPEMNLTNFNNSSEDSQSIPSKSDLDNLFGPLYEEYYVTSSQEVSDDSATNTTDNDHTSSSSSIVVDQDDAPPVVSSSNEQASTAPNFPVMNEDPLNMHQFYQQHRSTDRWTKNHPLEQVIGDPSKPEAMHDHSWIESMQDELNQFKRLDVWELVECPVGRNIMAVKWIWKNKTDAENTVIQNKSHLVAKGYRPEDGIDFEESFAPFCKTRSCQNFCGLCGTQEFSYFSDGC